jgi:PAP2 superfamily
MGAAAAWYYIVAHGAVVGIVGLLLIWRRAPAFGLHRNALIVSNAIGLAAFWLYPVAPPRMLPAYHDTAASAVPVFSGVLENNAAAQFASLPSLHVVWTPWVAVAASALLRHPAPRPGSIPPPPWPTCSPPPTTTCSTSSPRPPCCCSPTPSLRPQRWPAGWACSPHEHVRIGRSPRAAKTFISALL